MKHHHSVFIWGLFLFLVYSMIGWVIDTSYRSLLAGFFAPGSVTSLPFTPIYGFGALTILMVSEHQKHLPAFFEFLLYALLATSVEYVGGFVSTALLGRRLWDYSDLTLNLHGYISLSHTIFWGILAMILVHIIHPYVKQQYRHLRHA